MGNMDKFSDCVFVHFRLSQWSGKTAIRWDRDLKVTDDDRILDGSKQICPPSLLNPFISLEGKVKYHLDRYGFKFLVNNIWAIPITKNDEVKGLLDGFRAEFNAQLDYFKDNYDKECEAFFDSKKQRGDMLRKAKKPLADVQGKFVFSTSTFQLDSQSPLSDIAPGSLFANFVTDLSEQAAATIKRWDARAKPDKLKAQAKKSLEDIYEKVRSFSMLSPQLPSLGRHIKGMLDALPENKAIRGADIDNAYSVLYILQEPNNIVNFGKGLSGPTSQPTPKTQPADGIELGDFAFQLPENPEDFDLPDVSADFDLPDDFFSETPANEEPTDIKDTDVPSDDWMVLSEVPMEDSFGSLETAPLDEQDIAITA